MWQEQAIWHECENENQFDTENSKLLEIWVAAEDLEHIRNEWFSLETNEGWKLNIVTYIWENRLTMKWSSEKSLADINLTEGLWMSEVWKIMNNEDLKWKYWSSLTSFLKVYQGYFVSKYRDTIKAKWWNFSQILKNNNSFNFDLAINEAFERASEESSDVYQSLLDISFDEIRADFEDFPLWDILVWKYQGVPFEERKEEYEKLLKEKCNRELLAATKSKLWNLKDEAKSHWNEYIHKIELQHTSEKLSRLLRNLEWNWFIQVPWEGVVISGTHGGKWDYTTHSITYEHTQGWKVKFDIVKYTDSQYTAEFESSILKLSWLNYWLQDSHSEIENNPYWSAGWDFDLRSFYNFVEKRGFKLFESDEAAESYQSERRNDYNKELQDADSELSEVEVTKESIEKKYSSWFDTAYFFYKTMDRTMKKRNLSENEFLLIVKEKATVAIESDLDNSHINENQNNIDYMEYVDAQKYIEKMTMRDFLADMEKYKEIKERN